jgi:carboxypeptidase PM20D1
MTDENGKRLERLAKAVSIPTISRPEYEKTDFGPFDEFIGFLCESYPAFHEHTTLTKVADYSLVYRWAGRDANLAPICLMAHYDVVPADGAGWKHPPFSGDNVDGRVWGRGTLDIKSQLTAHIEAAESLMRAGWQPERDIYFAYGHDEEVGGQHGAAATVRHFKDAGIRFEGVLDEGGLVTLGEIMKGVDASMALIGTAEKGFCNYEFTFAGEGGHASMPPAHTALGRAAAFVTKVESSPMQARLTPPVLALLRNMGSIAGGSLGFAIKSIGLLKGVILKVLAKAPVTNAMIRTTFAATQASASAAPNVLPDTAKVVINVRILPGDSVAGVEAYFRSIFPQEQLAITLNAHVEPSPISPDDSLMYKKIAASARRFFPDAIVSPWLVTGGTDSTKFYAVSNNVYRFTPMAITEADRQSIHGDNESIDCANYLRMIDWYKAFIEGFDGGGVGGIPCPSPAGP